MEIRGNAFTMTTETAVEVTRLIERAFEGTDVGFLNAHGRPDPIPVSSALPHLSANDDSSIRYRIKQVANEATPWQYGPAFGDLQRWVDHHLREPTEVRPPEGTVAFCGSSNYRPERIQNPVVATRILLLAAAYYGARKIGRLVAGFLGHGLIQAHQFCLLKGFAIESRITLDDYCTLIPYREMVRYLKRNYIGTLDKWPDEDANVCVLRATQFEDRFVGPPDEVGLVYGSPLMKYGADHLALLLSLSWGFGFSCFLSQDRVSPAVNASLPFDDLRGISGGIIRRTELLVIGFRTQERKRPLPVSELSELAVAYLRHDEPTRRVLNVALRWFRESLTRTAEPEDAVISQGIALEALFGEPGKHRGFRKRLSSRGSWYYADSQKERHDTRQLIQNFYDLRSQIAHGGAVSEPDPSLTEGISRVLRSSIKSMILNGRPSDWIDAAGDGSIRSNPPRSDDVIPSDKADSLSWSLREQKEIDTQLRRAWESTLADQPNRPADTGGPCVHHGPIRSGDLSLRQERGIPYVIGHPARLYMAHPKWPRQPSDELDDRTLYYCSQDIDRHLESWRQAALERRCDYISVNNDAELYHPKHRDRWPEPLG